MYTVCIQHGGAPLSLGPMDRSVLCELDECTVLTAKLIYHVVACRRDKTFVGHVVSFSNNPQSDILVFRPSVQKIWGSSTCEPVGKTLLSSCSGLTLYYQGRAHVFQN